MLTLGDARTICSSQENPQTVLYLFAKAKSAHPEKSRLICIPRFLMTKLYQSMNFDSSFNIRLDRNTIPNPNTGKKSTHSTWMTNLAENIDSIRVRIVSNCNVATFFLPLLPNVHFSRVVNKVTPPNTRRFGQTTYSVIAHVITQGYSITPARFSTLVFNHQNSLV